MKKNLIIMLLIAGTTIGLINDARAGQAIEEQNTAADRVNLQADHEKKLEAFQKQLEDYRKDFEAYQADPSIWTVEIPVEPVRPD